MAIQSRRGKQVDFDPDKMLPGEWAVSLDTKEIYMCFVAGDVRRMATYEEMVENINSATGDVQAMFTADVQQAIRDAVGATTEASQKIVEMQSALTDANAATERAMSAAEAAEGYVLGDVSGKTVAFTEAASRNNVSTGESLATLFGKIKKCFSDLGTAAFKTVANNLTTTDEGYVLDARQGKELSDIKVDKIFGKGLSANDYTNEEKEKLAELTNDSGWIYPTTPNFRAQSGDAAYALRYRKIGKQVYVTGSISSLATIPANDTTDASVIFTLPVGFRPVVTNNRIMNGTSQAIWALRITTAGVVSVYRYRNGSAYGEITTSTMLNIETTFFVD